MSRYLKTEPAAAPAEFARFDNRRATIDRLKAEILSDRDRYLRKKRYMQANGLL